MRSNERATWPTSSGDSSPMGWSKVPAATRLAASLRRSSLTEIASAAPQPTTTATAIATRAARRIWRSTSAAAAFTSLRPCERKSSPPFTVNATTTPPFAVRPRATPDRSAASARGLESGRIGGANSIGVP